jgi:hypothetical protein
MNVPAVVAFVLAIGYVLIQGGVPGGSGAVALIVWFCFWAFLIGYDVGSNRERERPAREAKKQADRKRELENQQYGEELRRRWAEYQTLTEAEKQQPEWAYLYEKEHEEDELDPAHPNWGQAHLQANRKDVQR